MKPSIIRILLAILNSRWLNQTPCKYGFVGNVESFDIDHLRYEVRERPLLTVATLIAEAEHFAACPAYRTGVTVITATGYSAATDQDIEDVRNLR